MKRKFLRVLSLLLVIVMSVSVVGCNSEVKESNEMKEEKEVKETAKIEERIEEYKIPDRKGNWGYPTPYGIIPRGPGFMRLSYVFDSLIWKDQNGDFIPALSKKWAFNEDENTYTFELQENAKWHDGKKVTANDVIFTVNYMKKHPIYGLDLKNVEGVTALEENKVKFKLKEKWAPFYANIAGFMPIIPEHIYKDVEEPKKFLDEKAAIGSGPFKLASYNAEKGEYVFEAFEEYYQGPPKVKKLKFFKMNPQMQPKALLQGDVDAISTNGDAEKLFKGKDINVISDKGMITKVAFNHQKEPFDKKEFRHALAYLINTDDIIDIAHRGHAFKGYTGMLSKESPYFEEEAEQYLYNPKKAAVILEDLGYKKDGAYYKKDGEILGFEVLGHERVKRDVDIIVEQLNNGGIKAEAVYKDLQMADQMIVNWDFDISVVESGGTGDPIYLNRNVFSKSAKSDRYEKSEKINTLLKEQLTAVDFEERKRILKEFQKVYADELPSYYMYFSKFVFGYNDKLDLYFTNEGVSIGIPLALNKMIFVK